MRHTPALLLFLLVFYTGTALARTEAGVTMPESAELNDTALQLNGVGIRKATFLKVKVYVAGLYLEAKSKDPEQIIASSGKKVLKMHFVRGVSARKLVNGWNEGFKKNTPNLNALSDRISTFNAYMSDIESGQEIVLEFMDNSVEVTFSGKKKGVISGADFSSALLAIWLGKHPPNSDLKSGLLGH